MSEIEALSVLQIVRGILATLLDNIKFDFLPFDKLIHASPLNRGNVNEHVLGSVVRLDEAEATLDVEKFYGSDSHEGLLWSFGGPAMRATIAARGAAYLSASRISWRDTLIWAYRQAAEADNYTGNLVESRRNCKDVCLTILQIRTEA